MARFCKVTHFFAGTSPNSDRSQLLVILPHKLQKFLAGWPRMSVPAHAPKSCCPTPHPFPLKPVGQPGPRMPPTRQILSGSALLTRRAASFVAVSSLLDDTSAVAKCDQAVVGGAIKFSTVSRRLAFSCVDRSEGIWACFVAETGVTLAVRSSPGHGLQAKMRRFSAPRQHGGQVATHRRYLFPPTGL